MRAGRTLALSILVTRKLAALIDANPDEPLPVSTIVRERLGVTDHALRRSFEMVLGVTTTAVRG